MLSSFTTILALAAVARAVPAAAPDFSGPPAHSVPAVRNGNFVRNGTAALLKAYAKHGLTPTREMPKEFYGLEKRQDSTALAYLADHMEYLVPVTIGGQSLDLDFDTGSSDFWVFSSELGPLSRGNHKYYTSSRSPTYTALDYTWAISYAGKSEASGIVGTDTVVIGGTTVTKQAVELASHVSSDFVLSEADGSVGLAFDSINTVSPVRQKTFFSNAESSLHSPLFAAYLPSNADGAYDFGYTDTSHYTGTIKYATVDSSNGFWEFPSTAYKIGTSSTVYTISGRTAIADSGSSLILTADAMVTAYYAQVSGARYSAVEGGYIFPCKATLPALSFKIGPTYYATIPASLMIYGTIIGIDCFGSLQSVGNGPRNIYGNVFFNAYYGVFSANGPKFGFAPIA